MVSSHRIIAAALSSLAEADSTKNGRNGQMIEVRFKTSIALSWLLATSAVVSLTLSTCVQAEALAEVLLAATPSGTEIRSVTGKAVLLRRDGKLVQPIDIDVSHVGDQVQANLRILDATRVDVTLNPGEQTIEAYAPESDRLREVTLQIKAGDRMLATASAKIQPVRKWEIHLIHQTHLDIGYTHTQPEVLKRQVQYLHQALDLVEKFKDYPEDARFKWHPEGMWAIDEFLRTATPEKREQFIAAVRKGYVHLDAFYVHMMSGLGTEEELLQLMQPAKDFEKQYGVKVTTAIGSDVPGYTWGLVSAMGQQGVKYFNMAPNNNHRLGYIYRHGNQPFYWQDQSGQHEVLTWMSPTCYIYFWFGRNRRVGPAVLEFIEKYLVRRDYPYDIAQIRYEIGGDNGPPDPGLPAQVKAWNEQYAYPKIILSTNTRLFTEFERRYGNDLPTLSGDLTPFWEDGATSTSRGLAACRRAKESLLQSERLWTIRSPRAQMHDLLNKAWHNAIMYDEHTWGASGSISKPFDKFTVFQEEYKEAFATKTRELAQEMAAKTGGTENASATFDIYNTASWDRDGLVFLSAGQSANADRLVGADGVPLPTQRLKCGELAIRVPSIPALGARRFTLQTDKATATGDVIVAGNTLENSKLKIGIDPKNGSVMSFMAKSVDKELVDADDGFGLNDYLYTLGRTTGQGYSRITTPAKITVEDAGPMVGTLKIETDAPGCNRLVRRIRIYANSDRVDLINDVDKRRQLEPESAYFAFPFHVPDGQVRIDVPFSVVRPEKDQLAGANRNYYCVQRWVDVSNDEYGVTWITRDAPMLKFHPFRIVSRGRGCLPAATQMYDNMDKMLPCWLEKIDPGTFFYSWIMTNHWETNYKASQEGPHTFCYTVVPHSKYDQAAAQRIARNVTQPLLAVSVTGDAPMAGAPLKITGSDGVVITSLRPSRDGKATMVRLFAGAGKPEQVKLQWALRKNVYLSDLQESCGRTVEDPIELPAYGVVTLRAEDG